MKISKTQKLLRALSTGKNLSVPVLEYRTGLANVRAAVHRVRNQGVDICLNTRMVNGQPKNYYQLVG